MATANAPTMKAMSSSTLETIVDSENLLILVPRPGDESLASGGLIARCCRRGRAPFVVVLTDGSTTFAAAGPHMPDELARLHERETRAAVRCLGLPAQRLLVAGLFDGTVPLEGSRFDALIRGITLVMWARDCNVICAPALDNDVPDQIAATRIAVEVAERSGVGLLYYNAPDRPSAAAPLDNLRLEITSDMPAKRAAIAAHTTRFGAVSAELSDLQSHEVFYLERSSMPAGYTR